MKSRRVPEETDLLSPTPFTLTSSILVAEVREAPHVAQADDGAGDRQNKLHLVVPLAPLLHLFLRWGLLDFGHGAIGDARFGSVS